MKLRQLIALIPVVITLIVTPLAVQAKEHAVEHKGKQHLVATTSKHHNKGHSKGHNKGHSKGHYKNRSHKRYYSSHNRSHKRSHYRSHRRHKNLATALIVGAAIHHSFGIHGSHYNGHAWCVSHNMYHTHGFSYRHSGNHHYDHGPRKVDSYIEEDEGRCFRVIEYSNGDERRKRIRDHYCDEADWENGD